MRGRSLAARLRENESILLEAYRAIAAYTTARLRRWLCKKHKQRSGGSKRYPDEFFYQQMGLICLPQLPQSFPWAKA